MTLAGCPELEGGKGEEFQLCAGVMTTFPCGSHFVLRTLPEVAVFTPLPTWGDKCSKCLHYTPAGGPDPNMFRMKGGPEARVQPHCPGVFLPRGKHCHPRTFVLPVLLSYDPTPKSSLHCAD